MKCYFLNEVKETIRYVYYNVLLCGAGSTYFDCCSIVMTRTVELVGSVDADGFAVTMFLRPVTHGPVLARRRVLRTLVSTGCCGQGRCWFWGNTENVFGNIMNKIFEFIRNSTRANWIRFEIEKWIGLYLARTRNNLQLGPLV